MRFMLLATCLAIFGPTAVDAQRVDPPFNREIDVAPTISIDRGHISGASIAPVPIAEWEVINVQGPRVMIASGEAAAAILLDNEKGDTAQSTASSYEAKDFLYPTGTIRVLVFKKENGGVLHEITFETELFVLKGSAEVGVAGKIVQLKAGDAVHLPSGTLRSAEPVEDTTIVTWAVTGTVPVLKSKASIVYGKDAVRTVSAAWMEDGKPKVVRTEDEIRTAPAGAGINEVNRYNFDGNSIRLVKLKKGGTTNPRLYPADSLIYMTEGHMRRTVIGESTFDVVAGDAVREVAGTTGYWEILKDSVFVTTSSEPVVRR